MLGRRDQALVEVVQNPIAFPAAIHLERVPLIEKVVAREEYDLSLNGTPADLDI